MNENRIIAICITLIFILPILFLFLIAHGDENLNDCEDIGGKYEVIGQEYHGGAKRTIDVYGCVK